MIERLDQAPAGLRAQDTIDALLDVVDFGRDVRDDIAVLVARVRASAAS